MKFIEWVVSKYEGLAALLIIFSAMTVMIGFMKLIFINGWFVLLLPSVLSIVWYKLWLDYKKVEK